MDKAVGNLERHYQEESIRYMRQARWIKVMIRLPEDVRCLQCRPHQLHDSIAIDMTCGCVGTLREAVPFSEVWGI